MRVLFIINSLAEQGALYLLLELPVSGIRDRLFVAEHFRHCCQEFHGVAERGIKDKMAFDFFIFIEISDQLAAERCFAGTYLSDYHVQAPPHANGEFQLLQAAHLLPGLEENLRVR